MTIRLMLLPLLALAVVAIADHAQAGMFFSDFDGIDDDAFVNIASSGGNGAGTIDNVNEWLVLTNDNDNQLGTPYLPDLDPGNRITAFSSTFQLNQSLGDDADEADGVTVFFGKFANTTTALSDGAGLSEGLRVRFHIEDNGFSNPDESIRAYYNNAQIFRQQFALTTDTLSFRDVAVSVSMDGELTVSHGGTAVINALSIPGWTDPSTRPQSGWQFALTGRTGGRNAYQFIDDLSVQTVIPEPSTLLIWSLGLLGLAWCARRRRRK